ncbi:MAG TPA: UDP-galactopyranose mutase [Candidatus Sumerlaeota bacterium]|nr:UDP-galactopyranose mutase [Candidatus Sumerlaeota bacterium]
MPLDYLIVGAGLFGSVFAQQMHEAGRSVLVIDRRPHHGGNCYSEDHPGTNITVHRYGTHIFHTNNDHVWRYINRFTEFNRYQHRVLTTHRDRVYSLPINLATINQFYGVNLKPSEVEAFLAPRREGITQPRNLEEKAISLVGRDLYEAFIKGYTIKQWDRDPRELPAAIVARLPWRTSYDDAYFDDRYQGIPVGGYTPIFERMLEGIDVELGVDFFDNRAAWEARARRIVYTGPIDRFHGYRFGRLAWRSVRFEVEQLDCDDFQGTSVMNYADVETPWTRIHEPKHLHREKTHRPAGTTVIMREYSQVDPEAPYYPVNTEADRRMLARYEELNAATQGVIFGGRLAEYKYYDMHQVIAGALARARRELT